jgi:hypothetical protein
VFHTVLLACVCVEGLSTCEIGVFEIFSHVYTMGWSRYDIAMIVR